MIRRVRVSLWTDLECASGTKVADLEVVGGIEDRGLDLVDSLEVSVVPGDLTLADFAVARRVLRVDDPVLGVHEYPVLEAVEREAAGSEPVIRLRGAPVWTNLSEGGFYDTFTSGGGSSIVLGDLTRSVSDWITGIVESADRNGADYYSAGSSIASWSGYEVKVSVSEASPWQVLQGVVAGLAQTTGQTPDLLIQRNGSIGYHIDILTSPRGSSLASRRLELGVNLSSAERQVRRGDLATVVRPRGLVPGNEVEPSDISDVALRVTDITGSVITVEWPDAPAVAVVGFADQLNGLRAIFPDGSLVEITDSAVGDTLTLASVSGLAEGDLIGLAADSSGTPLQEITAPASRTSYGRRLASPSFPVARRERNWILNPQFEDEWDPEPKFHLCRVISKSGTTLTLDTGKDSLPVVSAGDQVIIFNSGQNTAYTVTTGGTPASDGEIALTLAQDPGTTSTYVLLSLQGARNADNWTAGGVSATRNKALVFRRPINAATDTLSWTANNLSGSTTTYPYDREGGFRLDFTSVSPSSGDWWIGDRMTWGANQVALACFISDFENEDRLFGFNSGGVGPVVPWSSGTIPGNQAVTVTAPPLYLLADYTGENVTVLVEQRDSSSSNRAYLRSETVNVRSYTGRSSGWARVHFLVWPISDVSYTGDRKVTLRVLDGSGTELATVTDIDRTLTGGTAVYVDLGVQVDLTGAVDDLRLEFRCGVQTSTAFPQVFYFLASGQFTVGADDTVPPVRFSFGNELYRRGLSDLVRRSTPPETLEVGFRDLAYDDNYVAAEWSVDVGQTVQVVSSGIDETARVVRRRTNLTDPVASELVVGADAVRLTRGSA